MIVEVIKREFGIKLSKTAVGRLLHQLCFICQKPLYRVQQRDTGLVEQWKKQVFPQIQKRAKKEGADIYFGDESGVRSDFHAGTTWALKGKTPVVETTGALFGLNMVAAISPRGDLHFMTVQGSVNADQICEFLKRLMHDSERKVFLNWDRHLPHKAKKVRECVESFDGRLQIFLLPSYSPDLNPTEQLWNHAKTNSVERQSISAPDILKKAVIGKLRSLQKLPVKIASFFRHPNCRYILAAQCLCILGLLSKSTIFIRFCCNFNLAFLKNLTEIPKSVFQ